MKHPVTVAPLNERTYHTYVKAPSAKGSYPATLAGFLARHSGATHGVFDAEGRLVYIGPAAELHAAHGKS